MSTDHKDFIREGSEAEESLEINSPTPEPEPITGVFRESENVGQQKRKGGRKPIYATSEERKQRNRQAQAAFRERRTEYIKQLEDNIRVHETNLHNLQTAHRSAADECLMLRYKNSLLERILLEKGIDVQAELRAKTGSPHLAPTHLPQSLAPTAQRAMMNRHHQVRRVNSNIAPKLEPGAHQSPQSSRRAPSSHASSPTSHSPGFLSHRVISPTSTDSQVQFQQQKFQLPKLQQLHTNAGLVGTAGGMGTLTRPQTQESSVRCHTEGAQGAASYYASSGSFQNHIEQLEQEYDAQDDMIVHQDPAESGPEVYPESIPMAQLQQLRQQQFPNQPESQPLTQLPRQSRPQTPLSQPLPPHSPHGQNQGLQMGENAQNYGSMAQLLDPFDPILDLDPFGLSASMQFPSSFSFDTSSLR